MILDPWDELQADQTTVFNASVEFIRLRDDRCGNTFPVVKLAIQDVLNAIDRLRTVMAEQFDEKPEK